MTRKPLLSVAEAFRALSESNDLDSVNFRSTRVTLLVTGQLGEAENDRMTTAIRACGSDRDAQTGLRAVPDAEDAEYPDDFDTPQPSPVAHRGGGSVSRGWGGPESKGAGPSWHGEDI